MVVVALKEMIVAKTPLTRRGKLRVNTSIEAGFHATVAQYMIEHQAQSPKSMAALMRIVMSFISVYAIKQGCTKFTNEEGLNYLRQLGLVDGDPHETKLPHFNVNALSLDESIKASEALARPMAGNSTDVLNEVKDEDMLNRIRELARAVANGEDVEVPESLSFAVEQIREMANDMIEEKDNPSDDAAFERAMRRTIDEMGE